MLVDGGSSRSAGVGDELRGTSACAAAAAAVYFLSKEEGGRHTPFYVGHRTRVHVRSIDVNAGMSFPEDVQMASPGDTLRWRST